MNFDHGLEGLVNDKLMMQIITLIIQQSKCLTQPTVPTDLSKCNPTGILLHFCECCNYQSGELRIYVEHGLCSSKDGKPKGQMRINFKSHE